MKTPKRINKELFDSELLDLINATARIFPISQADVDTNNNPGNYEYGRVDNALYRWDVNQWSFIIADDIDIDWNEIKNKPISYTPSVHSHDELHDHMNKLILDGISQAYIDLWNSVGDKAEATHTHTEANITDLDKYTKLEVNNIANAKADSTHNHDTVYYTEFEVDNLLSAKANSLHDHDGSYYLKSEVDGKLVLKSDTTHTHTEANITDLDKYTKLEVNTIANGKADTGHSHSDLHNHTNKSILDKAIETTPELSYDLSQLKYIEDIRAGYTEGHSHNNFTILETITQVLIDGWNSAYSHISDAIKHITSAERTLWNTVTGKAEEVHSHTKTDITDLSLDWIDITSKPLSYPPDAHNHDLAYYTETEVDTKLSSKADTSTLTGHTGNSTIHVTQLNKDSWNGKAEGTHNHLKADITDFPTSLPADGGNSDTVDGKHASEFMSNVSRIDYKTISDDYVVGQIMWKKYGNSHTIFDASNGTTPTGVVCDASNPTTSWTVGYPTLMGYNGTNTYGVRVDRSKNADNADSLGNVSATSYMRKDSDNYTTGYIHSEKGIAGAVDTYGGMLVAPGGGAYTSRTSSETGAIKITLPIGWSSDMIRFTVKIYEYTTGESFDVVVGGYTYGSGTWINTFAYILSTPTISRNFNVRFGVDGGNPCVWIGETGSVWSYPQIYVTDFQGGYTTTVTNYTQGWNISIDTAFGTINVTHSNIEVGKGGNMTSILKHFNNTSYTTAQGRNIIYSTANPSGGGNGDMWVKYT